MKCFSSYLPAASLLSITSFLTAAPAPVDYAGKIAPLWQEHCVDCHGADEPDGDLNMDSFTALMKGGKTDKAIIPGNAQDSLLVKFLEGRSGKEGKNQFMPPGKKEHLKPDEIAMIRAWIDGGAVAPQAEKKPTDILLSLPKINPAKAPPKAIQSLAASPDGKLLASGQFSRVELLDAATRKPVRTLEGIAGKATVIVFSPDGASLFVAAGDSGISGVAYQFKVADGSLVRKYEGHTDALYALALSPDGRTLVTGGYDQKIRLWSITTGTELRVLTGHNGGVFGLAFRPDGKVLASTSADRTVKLWEVATGKRLDTFSQPLKEQNALAFSPDGKTVASAGADNRIRVWNVTENAVEGTNKLLFTRFAHEGAVLNLAYSKDGASLVSTASDKSAKVWDAATLTVRHLLEAQPDWAPALTLLTANQAVLGRLDGSLAIYDVATGKPVSPPAPKPAMTAAAATATATGQPAMPASAKPKAAVKVGPPELMRIAPRGVQSGTVTKLRFAGKNFFDIKSVNFGTPLLKGEIKPLNKTGDVVEVTVTADAKLPRSQQDVWITTATGQSAKLKIAVDNLPQIEFANDPATRPELASAPKLAMPINVWGTLAGTGQQDDFIFSAKQGETVVFDIAAKRLLSKVTSPCLEIFGADDRILASNSGLDSGSDPFLAFTAPADGEYKVRVRDITLQGSAEHFYRLTAGVLPYVTGWWPLSLPANQEGTVHLSGPNLKSHEIKVTAGADGEVALPMTSEEYRSRVNLKVDASRLPEVVEVESGDALEKAQVLALPSSVNGLFKAAASQANTSSAIAPDVDYYAFDFEKGQQTVLETRASMMGSPADTKIDMLDAKGQSVPMMRMQATKDSSITLRSEEADDAAIRLFRFDEMELNDYMYFNGEILKIFRLARGPDADMVYFANGNKRRAFFHTSPAGHGLDEACYVVRPKRVDEAIVPNGLPVFTLNYSNDDDGERKLGRDSYLVFTAPEKGRYYARVSDTRGWSGERYAYRLIARAPQPDFNVNLTASKVSTGIGAGTGEQFALIVDRIDGFDEDVRVDITNTPAGTFVPSPITIQAGHLEANGSIFVKADAKPGLVDWSKVRFTATAKVKGRTVTKNITAFPSFMVKASPKQMLHLEPDVGGKPVGDGKSSPAEPYEITVAPGSTTIAWMRADRRGDDNGFINLDLENLPEGIILDNLGLNGAQIRPNESDREIHISCAKWVPEQDCWVHGLIGSARASGTRDNGQTSMPVLLKVRKPTPPVVAK